MKSFSSPQVSQNRQFRNTLSTGRSRSLLKVRAEAKEIVFDQESRRKLQQGIAKVANAVAVTLGPRGRNVVLQQSFGIPQVVNDGVTIARAIDLADPLENAGAQLIKEVAGRTNDSAGDGTTTASILAKEMIKFGLQAITAGANPVPVKKGIDKTCQFLVERLREKSIKISSNKDIKNIAVISANNDEEIGQMIADALDKVGADGVLQIESSNGLETRVDVQEGLNIDRGYISPQFVTNTEKLVAEYDNAKILITDQKIERIQDILPILEGANRINAPLILIAEDVTGDALATLVVNKMRGIVKICAIKAPSFGERRKSLLQDIAIVTGGDFIAKDLGLTLDTVQLEQLGTAKKITVGNTWTTMIADQGSKDDITARIAQLKRELDATQSTYDTEKLAERIAKLAGGIAIIKVGAATEAELEDRKLRIEDAKNATFAAVQEGIVPGGGTALFHLSELVPGFRNSLTDDEEKLGADIVRKSLSCPVRQIANNAGVEGEVITEKLEGQPFNIGYNAMINKVEDLVESGVIDPVKVTRHGLQNACGIAGIMLTTQAVMVEKQKGKIEDIGFTKEGMPAGMTI